MEQHLVLQSVVGDPVQIRLPGGVELPRHDQPAALGAARAPELRPGVEQQVKPLVIADQPEEKHVAVRRVQPQTHARLGAFDPLAEVLEQRVRRKQGRSVAVRAKLAVHLLGHVDEAVHRMQVVAVEGFVGQVTFVRLDVVDLAQHLRMAVAAGDACNGPETGGHEGRPVLHQHEIGTLAAYPAADAHPVQRIHRIDAAADAEVRRRRRRNRLALAGKQQRGILQREGLDVDLVAPPLERAGHDLHDRGQAPAVGMGRS